MLVLARALPRAAAVCAPPPLCFAAPLRDGPGRSPVATSWLFPHCGNHIGRRPRPSQAAGPAAAAAAAAAAAGHAHARLARDARISEETEQPFASLKWPTLAPTMMQLWRRQRPVSSAQAVGGGGGSNAVVAYRVVVERAAERARLCTLRKRAFLTSNGKCCAKLAAAVNTTIHTHTHTHCASQTKWNFKAKRSWSTLGHSLSLFESSLACPQPRFLSAKLCRPVGFTMTSRTALSVNIMEAAAAAC